MPYRKEYAVQLNNQSVNGLSLIPTPTPTLNPFDVVLPSSTVTNTLSSSPTILYTDYVNSKLQ